MTARLTAEYDNAGAISARRRAILHAADDLLAEEGLDGLTIRAVLARTKLARRAFYDVFATKDDLVLALFEHAIAEAAVRLAIDGAGLPTPADRLVLVIHSIVAAAPLGGRQDLARRDRRSAAFSREHLRLAQVRPEQLQHAIKPLVDLICRIIVDGIEAGQWESPAAERSARFIYNLVSTTVHTETLDPGSHGLAPQEREVLASQLSCFCLSALSAPAAG